MGLMEALVVAQRRKAEQDPTLGFAGENVEYPVMRTLKSSGCGLAARHVLWEPPGAKRWS